ncbi:OFA family MFS transporter [bacterium]|nr:OFA family MFS transporter [bacterium]
MSSESIKNRGWSVAIAGLVINLALGILYSWSIFKDKIQQSINAGGEGAFSWDKASLNDPYAVCILVFAFSMIIAGKLQDKKGPRVTALIGGILVGVGFIILSLTTSYSLWILGFGVLAGMGIGFGYSAATPPALKWFPASKTGLIAGIVVSGFGVAPVYIAPLATFLVKNFGLHKAMLIFGILFLVIVSGASMLLKNPPADYTPQENSLKASTKKALSVKNASASEMMKAKHFYLIWFIYFIGAGAGLMVIGSISGLAKKSMGDAAFIAVAIMAIGNASGRIVAGILSDKIGKIWTLLIILLFQATLMFASIPIINGDSIAIVIVLLATFIGFNYGTNLSLFPSFSKSIWGMKNFGINYGILMTAWGLGGFIFSRLSQTLLAKTGNHNISFIIAGSALIFCAVLVFVLNKVLNNEALKAE